MSVFAFQYTLEDLSLVDVVNTSSEVTGAQQLDNPDGKVLNESNCDKLEGICDPNSNSDINGATLETSKEKVSQNEEDKVKDLKRGHNGVNFDFKLRAFWDLAMDSGLFRYQLRKNSLPTKVLPGKFNYVAQLNPDRAEKRRKPQEIESVNQPFSSGHFNFNKIDSKEVLFRLQPWYSGDSSQHLLLINVSPLEYGHVLLTPSRNKNHPQKLTSSGLRLSLELVLLNNSPNFRLGFNSLCGFASVNHEHYHAYYLAHRLFLEYAELERVIGDCYRIKDSEYPSGFCFVLKDHPVSEEGLNKLVSSVMTLGKYLQENNVAHNLFVVRGSTKNVQGHFDSVRVFVWARESSFGAKGCDAFNPALCELAGHFPIKNEAAYESLTEEFILNTLHAICDKPFQQVKTWIVADFIENLF